MKVDSMMSVPMMSYDRDDGENDDDIDNDGQTRSVDGGFHSKAEMRKSNKPIMEKKRRARINNCLNDLKGILLEAMKKDPARHSKLEKADILELTVKHLQMVQRNQLAMAMATDPQVLHRFKNGFSECSTEVNRYLGRLDGVDEGVRQRLSGHLGQCINGLQQVQVTPSPLFRNQGAYTPFSNNSMRYQPIIQQQQQQQQHQQHPTLQIKTTPEVPIIPVPALPVIHHPIPQAAKILAQPSSTMIGDHNNNNRFIPPSMIPGQNSNLGHNAFGTTTMVQTTQPHPSPEPITTSPCSTSSRSSLNSSSTHENLNLSLGSIASDSSNDKGTNTLGLGGSTPIDFSLKLNRSYSSSKSSRSFHMEMLNSSGESISSVKDNMWRPW